MKRSPLVKLALDGLMLGLVLVGFAYKLTGSIVHELLGLGLLGLFLLHGGWNWAWFRSLFKGHYSGLRWVGLTVNTLLLLSLLVTMLSGMANSDLLFRATGAELNWIRREIHTAAANWFLILMAVHLGLHWRLVMNEAGKLAGKLVGFGQPSPTRRIVSHLLLVIIAVAGIYASVERSLYARLIAYYSFGDWSFDESVAVFFIQYLAIVGLYASVAYYALRFGRWRARQPTSLCDRLPHWLCKPRQFES